MTNKKEPSKWILVCSILVCLIPFVLVFSCWFLMHYSNVSGGIERERTIGIQHDTTEIEILLDSARVGIEESYLWGIGGLLVGSGVGILIRKLRYRKIVSSSNEES